MALLEFHQYRTLAANRESLERLESLMRSAVPDRWQIVFHLKRLREKAEKQAFISTEEAIQVFAALQRHCSILGPSTQDALQSVLEPVIEQMGLTAAVNRAAVSPVAQGRNWSRR